MTTTKTLLKSALTIIITFGLMFSSALDHTNDPARFNVETPALNVSSDHNVVKAIIVDGEVFPMIDLPIVEITADLDRDNLVRGEFIDGNIVPSILLNEVVVTPNS